MELTYYGHSCFSVNVNGTIVLFDPFISQNPLAKNINIDEVNADYIFLSHGHGDHIGDVLTIAKQSNAQCVGSAEVSYWLTQNGIENVTGMNPGGFIDFGFAKVKGTAAIHSSSFDDGRYAGNPIGFLFNSPVGNFYFAGDTALTNDMQLIPLWSKLNFAVLPIGGHFTMDVDDAIHASNFINCDVIVGVHYDTFPPIAIDKQKAFDAFKNENKTLLLPAIGETITLG